MDKNAIRKYAVWARRELIARVAQKAQYYGISEERIIDINAESIDGRILSLDERRQRKALINKIKEDNYKQVIEEVAYTWFNRFCALRFMEVNGYLPSHVRVFTDDENNFKPQILEEAINLDLQGLDLDKVYELKDANDNEALFKYLIIVQCNAFNPIMPRMFQKISDYTELLFPDNLLRDGSVIQRMIELIPEEDWENAVQIIGWLYQYYNSEKKDEVFAALKKNVKITKENIPAVTQMFTPDWIVRYMVENSLGRLWMEGHPNDDLKSEWKYYLDEAEQELNVQSQLMAIRKEYSSITPEQIKCIDPCAGSGHILVYMFDILMQIYESYGYTAREAVRSIVENNIYGLDIDDRAAQLAYFAVMMKARQYDPRFLIRKDEDNNPDVPQPHVYTIVESNGIDTYALDYLVNGNSKMKESMNSIIKEMHDAKEYGSILRVTPVDFEEVYRHFDEVRDDISINKNAVFTEILPLVQCAEVLSNSYHIICTNPPYMGIKNMSNKLGDYLRKKFPENKYDLYGIFIEKLLGMLKKNGMFGTITQQTFMFLSRYDYLRRKILSNDIINLVQLGTRAFEEIGGEVVQTATFVIRNSSEKKYCATYLNLSGYDDAEEKSKQFFNKENYYMKSKDTFELIEGRPLAYWVTERVGEIFSTGTPLEEIVFPRQGMATSDNDRFLRFWYEVTWDNVGFGYKTRDEALVTGKKWFPYNKGGGFRKWYGNAEYVVNWENDGEEIRKFREYKNSTLDSNMGVAGLPFIFKENITWSKVCSAKFSVRYLPVGFLFDVSGCSIYSDTKTLKYVMALLNSNVMEHLLSAISQSLNFEVGSIKMLPVIMVDDFEENKSDQNILLAKTDWDSFETSWDFKRHPLIAVIDKENYEKNNILLSECYHLWKVDCKERFQQLKFNEEDLNRYFIDIYGLQKELSPEVENKDITIRLADKQREVKSLISYVVGCMFGRYSLDVEGLAYAGGEWDESKYLTYKLDKDNIIPICDDEYFSDDIVGRFVRFIEIVYGKDTLNENLRFIADALGGSGQPKDVIRNYFLNDFYTDHLKIYQKRPIYWLFDSGKKNGFKALVYMHRYQPDTIARMRTDYVHEQQSRYRTAIAELEQRVVSASTADRVKLSKRLKNLQEQAAEIQKYEEKIHHLADQYISIDLDDGVKKNYEIFGDVLAKIK